MSSATIDVTPVNDTGLNPAQTRFQKTILSRWKFRFFLIAKLPSAWISGLRVRKLERNECAVSVPFKWLTQNPFKSTYFACQAMAAEMSTGLISMMAIQGSKNRYLCWLSG